MPLVDTSKIDASKIHTSKIDASETFLATVPSGEVDRLQNVLQDIIQNIEIAPNWCIRHPHYKPLEPPAEILPRFQQLPIELQDKFLNLQLRSFLYGIYYNGSLQSTLSLTGDDSQAQGGTLPQNLENNSFLGVDIAFYERLHQSNSGKGYFSPGWQLIHQESDGTLAVNRHGLTLHVSQDEIQTQVPELKEPELKEPELKEPELKGTNQSFTSSQTVTLPSLTPGQTVAIRLPRNLVQNGFYMAVGNAGPHSDPDITRIYFNLTPEGAVAVMASLTNQLNALALPFSFKALYNSADYRRYDSAVLYIPKRYYAALCPILFDLYADHRSHFNPDVPLFTKVLAPGLAIAEEPNHKFSEQESFGTHRCQILVNALLKARQTGDESPENRLKAIVDAFEALNLDLQRPYLNGGSEDIYQIPRQDDEDY